MLRKSFVIPSEARDLTGNSGRFKVKRSHQRLVRSLAPLGMTAEPAAAAFAQSSC